MMGWSSSLLLCLGTDISNYTQVLCYVWETNAESRLHWFRALGYPLNKPPVTAEATPRERTWCEFSVIFQTQACIRFYGPSILKQTLDAEIANKLCQPCQLIRMTYCAHKIRINHRFLYYREQPGICVLKHVC